MIPLDKHSFMIQDVLVAHTNVHRTPFAFSKGQSSRGSTCVITREVSFHIINNGRNFLLAYKKYLKNRVLQLNLQDLCDQRLNPRLAKDLD